MACEREVSWWEGLRAVGVRGKTRGGGAVGRARESALKQSELSNSLQAKKKRRSALVHRAGNREELVETMTELPLFVERVSLLSLPWNFPSAR